MKNKLEVIQWGADRGILAKATPMSQAIKTLSEVEELLRAINSDDRPEIKDAYGDILVTIILGAELSGLDIEDCLQSAYDVISKRTGVMKNGTFVKDAPVTCDFCKETCKIVRTDTIMAQFNDDAEWPTIPTDKNDCITKQ